MERIPGVFDIQRGEEYSSSWYIGFAADDNCAIISNDLRSFTTFYEAPSGQNAWMPPKDEWEICSDYSDGVQPEPKLTWSDCAGYI